LSTKIVQQIEWRGFKVVGMRARGMSQQQNQEQQQMIQWRRGKVQESFNNIPIKENISTY
jgi:DNA gyrase inhibitor GyrI